MLKILCQTSTIITITLCTQTTANVYELKLKIKLILRNGAVDTPWKIEFVIKIHRSDVCHAPHFKWKSREFSTSISLCGVIAITVTSISTLAAVAVAVIRASCCTVNGAKCLPNYTDLVRLRDKLHTVRVYARVARATFSHTLNTGWAVCKK